MSFSNFGADAPRRRSRLADLRISTYLDAEDLSTSQPSRVEDVAAETFSGLSRRAESRVDPPSSSKRDAEHFAIPGAARRALSIGEGFSGQKVADQRLAGEPRSAEKSTAAPRRASEPAPSSDLFAGAQVPSASAATRYFSSSVKSAGSALKGESAADKLDGYLAALDEQSSPAKTPDADATPRTGAEKVLSDAVGGMRTLGALFQETPGLVQAVNAHPPLAALAAVGKALSRKAESEGPGFALPEGASDPKVDAPLAGLAHTAASARRVMKARYPDQDKADQDHKNRVALSTDGAALQAKFDAAQAEIEASQAVWNPWRMATNAARPRFLGAAAEGDAPVIQTRSGGTPVSAQGTPPNAAGFVDPQKGGKPPGSGFGEKPTFAGAGSLGRRVIGLALRFHPLAIGAGVAFDGGGMPGRGEPVPVQKAPGSEGDWVFTDGRMERDLLQRGGAGDTAANYSRFDAEGVFLAESPFAADAPLAVVVSQAEGVPEQVLFELRRNTDLSEILGHGALTAQEKGALLAERLDVYEPPTPPEAKPRLEAVDRAMASAKPPSPEIYHGWIIGPETTADDILGNPNYDAELQRHLLGLIARPGGGGRARNASAAEQSFEHEKAIRRLRKRAALGVVDPDWAARKIIRLIALSEATARRAIEEGAPEILSFHRYETSAQIDARLKAAGVAKADIAELRRAIEDNVRADLKGEIGIFADRRHHHAHMVAIFQPGPGTRKTGVFIGQYNDNHAVSVSKALLEKYGGGDAHRRLHDDMRDLHSPVLGFLKSRGLPETLPLRVHNEILVWSLERRGVPRHIAFAILRHSLRNLRMQRVDTSPNARYRFERSR